LFAGNPPVRGYRAVSEVPAVRHFVSVEHGRGGISESAGQRIQAFRLQA
jgi:hypothetical protein